MICHIQPAVGQDSRCNGFHDGTWHWMDLGINQLSGTIPDCDGLHECGFAQISIDDQPVDWYHSRWSGIPSSMLYLFKAHVNRLSGPTPCVVPTGFLVSDNQLIGSLTNSRAFCRADLRLHLVGNTERAFRVHLIPKVCICNVAFPVLLFLGFPDFLALSLSEISLIFLLSPFFSKVLGVR